MAIMELNNRTDLLPDVTISLDYIRMPVFDVQLAKLIDMAINICDNGKNNALITGVRIAQFVFPMCPQRPQFSVGPMLGQLGDKSLLPLFWTYRTGLDQVVRSLASIYSYFQWNKICIITVASNSILKLSTNYYSKAFPKFGIDIGGYAILPPLPVTGSNIVMTTKFYFQGLRGSMNTVKRSGIRIFFANTYTYQLIDVMLAANRTRLCGPNYDMTSIDPKILKGLMIIQTSTLPDFTDEVYVGGTRKFASFLNWTMANEAGLYNYTSFNPADVNTSNYYMNEFYDDPGIYANPAFVSLAAYDGIITIATAWQNVSNNTGMTGAAIVDNSLNRVLKFKDIQAAAASVHPLSDIYTFTDSGLPVTDVLGLKQYDGTSAAVNGVIDSGLFTINMTTAIIVALFGLSCTYYLYRNDLQPSIVYVIGAYILHCIFTMQRYWFARFVTSFKAQKVLLLILPFIAVTLTLLIALTVVAPLKSGFLYIDALNSDFWLCVTSDTTNAFIYTLYAYIALLTFAVFVLGFVNRSIPEKFNDSNTTVICAFIIFVGFGIYIAQSFTSATTLFLFESIIVILGVLGINIIILGVPVLIHVLRLTAIQRGKMRRALRRTAQKVSGSGHRGEDSSSGYSETASEAELEAEQSPEDIVAERKGYDRFSSIRAYTLLGTFVQQWRRVQIMIILEPTFTIRYNIIGSEVLAVV
eukprot:jgi/Hompol1/1176/HPOL_005524-RA